MTQRFAKVAVLMGGLSAEREVSLASGRAVAEALRRFDHPVIEIDAGRDVAAKLAAARPDAVWNALHGRWGEDGAVQGVLEMLRIPYSHSGIAASAIAMNKDLAKQLFAAHGLPLARHVVVDRASLFAADPLPRPFVVKPVAEGSSVGVAIVRADSDFGPDLPGPWREFSTLMVEEYIPGRELSVAVVDGEPLGVIELVPDSGFYDYDAKYSAGRTRHLMPAPLDAALYAEMMRLGGAAHRVLGCRGVTRTDIRFDDRAGRMAVLEINTQPGMTELSLVPEIAGHCGIGFDDLVARILDDAGLDK